MHSTDAHDAMGMSVPTPLSLPSNPLTDISGGGNNLGYADEFSYLMNLGFGQLTNSSVTNDQEIGSGFKLDAPQGF